MVLRNPTNRQQLVSSEKHGFYTTAPRYDSYTDGICYQNNPYFRKYPDALRLIIYGDDAEPCNGLSSRAGKNKISAIYFKIQNMPTRLNSSLRSIFPLIYAKTNDSKKYGYNTIFAPLVEDLKRLEKGVDIYFGNQKFVLRAALIAVAGDTLALHEMFGLLGPSANAFCRECTIDRKEFHDNDIIISKSLRDLIWYEDNLEKVETNSKAAKECGLKATGCVLNDLEAYHITDNHAFDVMHDLAEGIIPITIQLVLAHYYRNKNNGLTVEFINHRIKSFNYGFRDRKNVPSSNLTAQMLLQPSKHRLRQTASQNLLFLRAFPFLFGHLTPTDCQYMEIISVLINITRISFSTTIPDYLLAELEIGINTFYTMFITLFDRRPNKLHHLTHYPECIKQIGPLVQFDCRMFESKNKCIKTQMNAAHNYKNVNYSLAHRQVFTQAVNIAENPFIDKTEFKSGKVCFVKDLAVAAVLDPEPEARCFTTKGVVVNGVHFRNNSIVSVKEAESSVVPSYAEIKEIILIEKELFLFATMFEILSFDEKLQAYEVNKLDGNRLLPIKSVHCYTTFAVWKAYNNPKLYISRRIFNNDY